MRITAVVSLGREGLVDVEHEAQLGGAIHTKGVAIIRGYLSRIFGQERPLSIKAQIAFEQSYGEIDGDSASSSELFGVLSALSDVADRPGHRRHGQRQSARRDPGDRRRLREDRGLLRSLPRSRAHRASRASCSPARTSSTSSSARTWRARSPRASSTSTPWRRSLRASRSSPAFPPGERDASGRFPAASVFGRVERRVIEIAERLREAEAHHAGPPAHESMDDVSHADLSDAGDYRAR